LAHLSPAAIVREDDCRVRKGQAPQNFSTLRKFALALLRNEATDPKRSLRGRRKTTLKTSVQATKPQKNH
jgi:hypothetical protein